MADNVSPLGKTVVIGGSQIIRDSDYEEALVEGTMYIGDLLAKGTAETQVVSTIELTINFKGIAIGHVVRQSDTEVLVDALTAGQSVKYLKPSGGRYKVRIKAVGFDTGATVPSGEPVYFMSTGSSITASDNQLGKAYIDPACSNDAAIIGRLAKPAVAADTSSNTEDVEIEMWY